jgi:hypothetical protein
MEQGPVYAEDQQMEKSRKRKAVQLILDTNASIIESLHGISSSGPSARAPEAAVT